MLLINSGVEYVKNESFTVNNKRNTEIHFTAVDQTTIFSFRLSGNFFVNGTTVKLLITFTHKRYIGSALSAHMVTANY